MLFAENTKTQFKRLESAEELSRLFELSNEKPIVLFKHSTMCPLSADAYQEMSRFENEINLVIVQIARPISNEIESRTGIRHESPQVIILRNGNVAWHASHFKITTQSVTQAFQEL
jgi:bacillithiol system protein YtxJ